MSKELPETYIVSKFLEYAGYPKYKKYTNVYCAGCPVCKEGNSWQRKRRLNYIVNKGLIHCFNCGKTWSPLNWILEVSGMSYKDVIEESKQYEETVTVIPKKEQKKFVPIIKDLPEDSINLFDKQQVDYYFDNNIVQIALKYIKERRLDTAINKPRALYISLKDYFHKNRLVIPFYDEKNDVIWYQTRTLIQSNDDKPKYLSKMNSEKSVFGIDKIIPSLEYLFVTEGPIDSMFIQNGVSMAGLSLTEKQEEQIHKYIFHKKIWILDNEKNTNKEVKFNMNKLIEQGERVFFWPDKLKDFKDINELCVKLNKDSINSKFFIDNSYEGDIALLKLDQ